MRFGSMFYLLLFSKLFLKIFGTLFDKIDLIFSKIFNFIKDKTKNIKFKKKKQEMGQEN